MWACPGPVRGLSGAWPGPGRGLAGAWPGPNLPSHPVAAEIISSPNHNSNKEKKEPNELHIHTNRVASEDRAVSG